MIQHTPAAPWTSHTWRVSAVAASHLNFTRRGRGRPALRAWGNGATLNVSCLNQVIGFFLLVVCVPHLPIHLKNLSFFWGAWPWSVKLVSACDRIVSALIFSQSCRLVSLETIWHQRIMPVQFLGPPQEVVHFQHGWWFVEHLTASVGGFAMP